MTKKVNRPKINGTIADLVYKYWETDHSMTQILNRGELIRALQAFSDENIEIALAEGSRDGREDFGVPAK